MSKEKNQSQSNNNLKIKDLVYWSWKNGILEWKLDSLQAEILSKITTSTNKKSLILSSRRLGKSYLSCIAALQYNIKNPNSITRIIAPTIEQALDIANDNLIKIISDAPPGFIRRYKSELRWNLHNGSSIRIGGMKRGHVDANRGGDANLIVYEESGSVDGDDFTYAVDSVLGPQLLRTSGSELFVSTPSIDPEHPLHTRVKPDCENNNSFFSYSIYDSPSISPKMIEEAIRRCGGEDTESFQREYLAKIVRPSMSMIIPFENKFVVPFNKPPKSKWYITIDFGGVRDMTAALLHTYCFNSDKDLIYDELHWPSNTPTSQIISDLRDFNLKHNILVECVFADLPGQLQIDLESTFKYPVSVPPKNDWLSNVNSMISKFTMDKILIHPNCKFLIKTCRSAMFNKQRTDFQRNSELGHCDALAALMYALRCQDRSNPYGNLGTYYMGDNYININNTVDNHEVIDLGFYKSKFKFKKFGTI